VSIEFTGLREGEKLHEELFGEAEPRNDRREHALVSHVPVPALTDEEIDTLPSAGDPELLKDAMRGLCILDVTKQLERDYASVM
jgi:FlaA1/EpsC-like NDP-sugar epimerase